MARTDIPTLECDRCKFTTQDLTMMGKFKQLRHHHPEGATIWDLCPTCSGEFNSFMAMEETST